MKFFNVMLLLSISTGVSVKAQNFASENKSGSQNHLVADASYSKIFYEPKPPGLRMRNTGRTLTIIGGAMLVGGIIMASNADDLYYTTTYSSSGSYSEGDPQGGVGVAMIIAGTGMTIPGIIFWSKGSKKYRNHLENGASLNIKGSGLSLKYYF